MSSTNVSVTPGWRISTPSSPDGCVHVGLSCDPPAPRRQREDVSTAGPAAAQQGGYEVGRFVSLEALIEQIKESYYDALGASTAGWHEGEHDISLASRTSSAS